jgi:hypothetical protein
VIVIGRRPGESGASARTLASPESDPLYEQMMAVARTSAAGDDPYVATIKVLRTLARVTGYYVSKCPPETREFAHSVVLTNLEAGLSEGGSA